MPEVVSSGAYFSIVLVREPTRPSVTFPFPFLDTCFVIGEALILP